MCKHFAVLAAVILGVACKVADQPEAAQNHRDRQQLLHGRAQEQIAQLGIGLAKLFTLSGDPTHGMLPLFYLPLNSMLIAVAFALGIGALRFCTTA